MMLALSENSERIQATPDIAGICPVCGSDMIPKCGEIKTWHWAHKSVKDCDTWAEPEGDWHYGWKKWAGLENTEIVIKKDDKVHRADIKTPYGVVIELQHSPLSTKEVREREEFYGNMIWVVDGDTVCPGLKFDRYVSKDDRLYFRHSEINKAWVNEIRKPLYIHFGSLKQYDTYFYANEYDFIADTLTKKLKRYPITNGSKTVSDFLLHVKGKYCDLIPGRIEFLTKFGSYRVGQGICSKNDTPKSLFDF